MTRTIRTALTLSLALAPIAWVGPATAQQGGMGQQGMMYDDMPMHDMMQGQMMPGGMMGPGMMGPGMMGSGMMGGPMMQGGMMMPGGMMGPGMMGMGMPLARAFDTNGDGQLTPEEMEAGLRAELTKYDANSDGSLSLDEFQSFYAEMTRTMMVRAFQHADADGDGRVTPEEMTFGLPTTP